MISETDLRLQTRATLDLLQRIAAARCAVSGPPHAPLRSKGVAAELRDGLQAPLGRRRAGGLRWSHHAHTRRRAVPLQRRRAVRDAPRGRRDHPVVARRLRRDARAARGQAVRREEGADQGADARRAHRRRRRRLVLLLLLRARRPRVLLDVAARVHRRLARPVAGDDGGERGVPDRVRHADGHAPAGAALLALEQPDAAAADARPPHHHDGRDVGRRALRPLPLLRVPRRLLRV